MNNMLETLLSNNVAVFKELLQNVMLETMSYFDNSESFYNGFMLGLVVLLSDDYVIKSNRESGYGRFDIVLIPKNKTLQGVILEFKESQLKANAQEALRQIIDNKYDIELMADGVLKVHKYDIAFCKKNVEITSAEQNTIINVDLKHQDLTK